MNTFPVEIFRCPVSGDSLRPASPDELAAFNQAHCQSPPRTLGDGTVVGFPWENGWRTVTEPATWYPVIHDIPTLVPDAAYQD